MDKIIVSIIAIAIILIVILVAYCWHRKYFPLTDENIIYVMRPSREYFVIGIIGTIVFSTVAITSLIFFDEQAIVAFLIFYGFVLLGIFTCIVALLEKYVIKTDSLILYTPPLSPKEIRIYEISTVKIKEIRISPYFSGKMALIGYHDKKKLFTIDESAKGFPLLYDFLFQFGKIEAEKTEHTPFIENFSVTENTSEIVEKVVGAAFFLVLSVLVILDKDELALHRLSETIFLIAAALFLTIFFLSEALHALLWKITMDYHTISIRNSFGIVKKYEIAQITKVQESEHFIVLFSGQKKIAKIFKDYKNFDFLLERLVRKEIEIQKIK